MATVGEDLLGRQLEEAHEVGMGAEAAVTHPDPILGAESGGHQRGGTPSTLNAANGRVGL